MSGCNCKTFATRCFIDALSANEPITPLSASLRRNKVQAWESDHARCTKRTRVRTYSYRSCVFCAVFVPDWSVSPVISFRSPRLHTGTSQKLIFLDRNHKYCFRIVREHSGVTYSASFSKLNVLIATRNRNWVTKCVATTYMRGELMTLCRPRHMCGERRWLFKLTWPIASVRSPVIYLCTYPQVVYSGFS